ncbi:thymidine kinase [Alishewanella agri BL06]|mgnify:CR=1 FL=1|jgi:thymidine kinase|uniref:Thymidine kinase n=1 Tax=Alishewanella agri BL06 TaxID=1195246 RepID=I9P5N1_9ALTE|nr:MULTISPECIES: thymidine kinase [Alishewanella]EIW90312.1 thymidine kinase [Alishewanella agri BL06]KRS22743.1 thymidine kinase [Alishewanella sp. WH16-1]OYW93264.1 MAG: thymidine kinase [Alishewanella sp. 32-51-5]OZB35756.1 MAG: thymidine kinase [Alishewanella sp. 34-51-39]
MAQLYFYYSAMNAGKSTSLLQSAYNYQERGMVVAIYTAALDHRFGLGKVSSRIGLAMDAHVFDGNFNFVEHVSSIVAQGRLDCVLIDEAQFLTKAQVRQLTDVVDKLRIPVLAFGLRTDFLGETFAGSQALLAWADKLIELKTICHCGRKANFVVRLDEQGLPATAGSQVQIGGNESYVSMCRQHFKDLVWQDPD